MLDLVNRYGDLGLDWVEGSLNMAHPPLYRHYLLLLFEKSGKFYGQFIAFLHIYLGWPTRRRVLGWFTRG